MRASREMMAWHVALGALLALASPLRSQTLGSEGGSPQFVQLFTTVSDTEQNAIEPVPEIQKNAEHGDPNAEYKLGLVYDVGVGARQDLAKAALWYQRAADQGHVAAQFNLGLMYASGRGVPQDLVQAHMWLNLAAAGSQAAARGERDLVAKQMTRSQLGEAVRLAREWQPKAAGQ
jgi:TPR repeat protein